MTMVRYRPLAKVDVVAAGELDEASLIGEREVLGIQLAWLAGEIAEMPTAPESLRRRAARLARKDNELNRREEALAQRMEMEARNANPNRR